MKIQFKKEDWFDKEPVNWKRLIIVFIVFVPFAYAFEQVLHALPVELYRIKDLAIEDLDFTDIHYQYEKPPTYSSRKEVLLINSGSLERGATFRPKLTRLIEKLAAAQADKIGIDHYFVDIPQGGQADADSLEEAIIKHKVVFGVDGQYPTIFTEVPKNQQGYINLPRKDRESVRTYFNYYKLPLAGSENDKVTVHSFAWAMLPKMAERPADSIFWIKYSSKAGGFYNLRDPKVIGDDRHDFPALEARDILDSVISDAALAEYVSAHPLVLIGHLGKDNMYNVEDLTDKHRVPVDFDLVNRLPVMPGVVVHANAIQTLADNSKLFDVSGVLHLVVVGFLTFWFLFGLLQIKRLKPIWLELLVDVTFLILSILGVIRLSVALMDVGVHFHPGLLLLCIALLIEFKVFAFHFYDHMDKKKHAAIPDQTPQPPETETEPESETEQNSATNTNIP
ncbi:CHASE2 domain-containing protein [Flavobacterium sp.]|uniref:CHASE2 domain-containing protein n=1 Tax=Flavobacterium sp. TaxID=239 RepID=UPI0039E5E862